MNRHTNYEFFERQVFGLLIASLCLLNFQEKVDQNREQEKVWYQISSYDTFTNTKDAVIVAIHKISILSSILYLLQK